MKTNKDLLIFYNFLNEIWDLELFSFYLRCRKSMIQIKLGDNFKGDADLCSLSLTQTEWVNVAVKMFVGVMKPTTCVQRITSRLLNSEFTNEVPANLLLVELIEEYVLINTKNTPKTLSKTPDKPKPPPRQSKVDFDIMKYGNHGNNKKTITRENSFLDEELNSATVEESPPSSEKPVFYSLANGYDNHSEENFFQQEIQRIVSEKDKIKEALEETIDFCDSVSYEHDLLLIQNSKLKKLLSVVTDKLIRIDQDAINDIDFSDVLDDPCMDFKPTGILKEKKNGQGKFEKNRHNLLDLPFSETAGREINRKKVPATPKFSVSSNDFEDDIFFCIEDYLPSQPGLLNIKKGDRIKKISELDDWYFGENTQNGTRGFFPPNNIRQ
jgi:Variant SH3 domain